MTDDTTTGTGPEEHDERDGKRGRIALALIITVALFTLMLTVFHLAYPDPGPTPAGGPTTILDLGDGAWHHPDGNTVERYRYIRVRTPDGIKGCVAWSETQSGGLDCWPVDDAGNVK